MHAQLDLLKQFKLCLPVSPLCKNIPVPFRRKSPAYPLLSRLVTDAGWDAVDPGGAPDESAACEQRREPQAAASGQPQGLNLATQTRVAKKREVLDVGAIEVRRIIGEPASMVLPPDSHRLPIVKGSGLLLCSCGARGTAEIDHSQMQNRPANSATPMSQAGQTGPELGFSLNGWLGREDAARPYPSIKDGPSDAAKGERLQ